MSSKRKHPLLPAALLAGLLAGVSTPLAAETRWVSDELVITFRTQPSNRGEILRNLTSGASMELLEEPADSEWSRVRLPSGAEGWVRRQYLMNEPVAAQKLEAASREVAQLTRTVNDLRERLGSVQSERNSAQESSSSLTSQVGTLEKELAEIRRVSAGAMETAAENRELKELNDRLRNELKETDEERDRLAANSQQRWLMIGGGLVLTGLVLGLVLKSRPQRSAWS